ncbi:uncharacterized protein LOC141600600 [Silene latifolia]|uniref:uncharacterized protein LOC141600600 n=1 Tax=Silene latifolia TaxID=37657 RepID=UPI003D777DCF
MTPVDEEGGGNPEWSHPMTFDISRLQSIPSGFDDLLLVFKFRHQQLVGFKTVGEVQVPLRRLIEQATNENVKFVSYEVRNPEDKNLSECHRTRLVQQSSSNPEKIMYPKIDLEDLSDIIPTSLSPISPNISHYPTPVTVYPPPAEIQCSLPPPIPTHFLSPPPPYVVYPSIQYGYPSYGDPHCGYYQHG